jgi:hypothetical protein
MKENDEVNPKKLVHLLPAPAALVYGSMKALLSTEVADTFLQRFITEASSLSIP